MVASVPVHVTPSRAMRPVPWPKIALGTAYPVLLSPNCGADNGWGQRKSGGAKRCKLEPPLEPASPRFSYLAAHHAGCNIRKAVVAHGRPRSVQQPHLQAALQRPSVVHYAAADQAHRGCRGERAGVKGEAPVGWSNNAVCAPVASHQPGLHSDRLTCRAGTGYAGVTQGATRSVCPHCAGATLPQGLYA